MTLEKDGKYIVINDALTDNYLALGYKVVKSVVEQEGKPNVPNR